MKAIFAVMNTTWAVVKRRPEKKIQACTGFEPMTSAILVQREDRFHIHVFISPQFKYMNFIYSQSFIHYFTG